MAFNRQVFRTRALTAAVFVIIMMAGLLWNKWSFFLLITVIHFGCWIEYQRLVGLIDREYNQITPFHRYGVMLAGWCILFWFSGDGFRLFGIRLHEIGWWFGLVFIFILPITELLFTRNIRLKNIGHSAFGLVYISLSWGLMTDLYNHTIDIYANHAAPAVPVSPVNHESWIRWSLPLVVIASIWINDTMAYIMGSLIGKHPLSSISPKKTWEGTMGGILITAGVAWLIAWQTSLRIMPVILTAVIAAIAGSFGDLLESKLKRLAAVKDSGDLMPGHGGFLDRFDSLLLAIPFVWLYIQLILK